MDGFNPLRWMACAPRAACRSELLCSVTQIASLIRRLFLVVVLGTAAVSAQAWGAPVELFPGGSTKGWGLLTTPAAKLSDVCRVEKGGVLWVAGKPSGFLEIKPPSSDYTLHVEWRWPGKPGNGGILVRISSGPKDGVWPLSYQIQLKHGFAGDILPMAGARFASQLTSPAGARVPIRAHGAPDNEKPVGQWNSCDIVCWSDSFEVFINGVLQNQATGCQLLGGQLGFQLEGTPFELRNVRITRLHGAL